MNQKRFLKGIVVAMLSIAAFSCSDSDDTEISVPRTYNVAGKVEKGPFVSGSTVAMQLMDAQMQAVGETYMATIQDNAGNFSFGAKSVDTPYAELTANGYFFNEVSGDLSAGVLTLRSLVDLSDQSTIHVNILTHLKCQRVLNLVTQGKTFKEANAQAQHELFAAFGLSGYADTDASLFSIAAGNDESAALIAVSSLLLADRREAELTEYLAKLCHEFGQKGAFSAETKRQMKTDREQIAGQLSQIQTNIINRYEDLGLCVEVKDLRRFFDWDDDGVAGNETLKEGETITIETTRLEIPQEGGSYRIPITSPVPVYLKPIVCEVPDMPSVEEDFFKDLYENVSNQNISVEKHLQDNVLTLEVAPLGSRTDKTAVVNIYDCLGHVLGTVDLTQAGNKQAALPLLGESGRAVAGGLALTLADGLSEYYLLEQYYHHNKQAGWVNSYIYPESGTVSGCWNKLYGFNARLSSFKAADARQLGVYQEVLDVFSAMQYYYMLVAWGDVPYITDYDHYESGRLGVVRTAADVILDDLETNLKQAIRVLDDKKNESLKDINDVFFLSKDVARALLADIYMYRHDYDNALIRLDEIIKGGHYELDASDFGDKETINDIRDHRGGQELLFALWLDDGTRSRLKSSVEIPPVLPLQTYTGVMLSYAECLYRQGNAGEAEKLLHHVAAVKNITLADSDDVLARIAEARKRLLLYTAGNFAFMKRNGLAKAEYGIDDYRLLWPIPLNEMQTNHLATQNPGY